ncbi:DUF3300 domain-containing protein [Alteromonas gilva]|uniref:DUF3300 domain-containing protein n=1 Tax=Alteromonas gilva TaxID=2987522 RepID=A0ABT5KXU0_9ALTE|nr:DUF3300 domain-containing protein [Alteromonas gilva]MDC8829593.1 DUF3300 domain-containing protein [Alteromonas gilva]
MQKRILLATLLPLLYGGQATALSSVYTALSGTQTALSGTQATLSGTQTALSPPETQPAFNAPQISIETLDTLLAPIALYPDSVVTHILIASTYPLQVVEADRWRQANPNLDEAQIDAAIADFDWEPSVKALVPFTDVLRHMSDDLSWLQTLGDAVITNENQVLDRVQALRLQAWESGNLQSNDYQQVTTQERIIVIEPRRPEVVYIPYYDPHYVYGHWHHHRPPVYWPGKVRIALGHRIYWGPHVALSASFYFGHIWWPERHIIVRHTPVYRYTRPSYHKRYSVKEYHRWQHNAGKRHARYSKTVTRQSPAIVQQHRTLNKEVAHRKLYTATQALSTRGATHKPIKATSHKPLKATTHSPRSVTGNRDTQLNLRKPAQHKIVKPDNHALKQRNQYKDTVKRETRPVVNHSSQPRKIKAGQHTERSRPADYGPKRDAKRESKRTATHRPANKPPRSVTKSPGSVTKSQRPASQSKQRMMREH